MEHNDEVEILLNDLKNIVLRLSDLGTRSPHRIAIDAAADSLQETLDHLKFAKNAVGTRGPGA